MIMIDARKVLIIDDEVDCCVLMSKFFKKKNYQVFIAHTLSEGLNLLKNHAPDMIFLDNNLPDGLGWNEASSILQQYPSVRLNLISAYDYTTPQLGEKSDYKICEKPISLKKLEEFL